MKYLIILSFITYVAAYVVIPDLPKLDCSRPILFYINPSLCNVKLNPILGDNCDNIKILTRSVIDMYGDLTDCRFVETLSPETALLKFESDTLPDNVLGFFRWEQRMNNRIQISNRYKMHLTNDIGYMFQTAGPIVAFTLLLMALFGVVIFIVMRNTKRVASSVAIGIITSGAVLFIIWIISFVHSESFLDIMVHEFGHFVGLDHSDAAGSMMHVHAPNFDGCLGADDVAGVNSLYAHGVFTCIKITIPVSGLVMPLVISVLSGFASATVYFLIKKFRPNRCL